MDPTQLAGLLGLVGKQIRPLEKVQPQDLHPCHVRILRDGRGLPWNRRLAIHLRSDETITITRIP